MLLSVLDYAMVDSGRTSQEALGETVALAQLADELGYHRFWVAEHHQVPALASASPELMIMHLLGKTQRIMIGSSYSVEQEILESPSPSSRRVLSIKYRVARLSQPSPA